MAERLQVPIPCTVTSPVPNLRDIVDGWVTVARIMDQKTYVVPQYPTHCIDLLHVRLLDDGREFDAFIELCSDQEAPVTGDIYVEKGFFLQVRKMIPYSLACMGIPTTLYTMGAVQGCMSLKYDT